MRALIAVAALLAACQPVAGPGPYPSVPSPQAPSEGWPVASTGQACGGMSGTRCGVAGNFCRTTEADICMAADAMGVCTPTPEVCTQNYAPICGCDDRTYPNECAANAQGISISYQGECRPG